MRRTDGTAYHFWFQLYPLQASLKGWTSFLFPCYDFFNLCCLNHWSPESLLHHKQREGEGTQSTVWSLQSPPKPYLAQKLFRGSLNKDFCRTWIGCESSAIWKCKTSRLLNYIFSNVLSPKKRVFLLCFGALIMPIYSKLASEKILRKLLNKRRCSKISLMVYLILTKNDICLDFFQFPSTGGDIRIREGGCMWGVQRGRSNRQTHPPCLDCGGLWAGADSNEEFHFKLNI